LLSSWRLLLLRRLAGQGVAEALSSLGKGSWVGEPMQTLHRKSRIFKSIPKAPDSEELPAVAAWEAVLLSRALRWIRAWRLWAFSHARKRPLSCRNAALQTQDTKMWPNNCI